jgi:transposase
MSRDETSPSAEERIAALEAALAAERAALAAERAALAAKQAALDEVTRERDLLRVSHERLRLELELLRRRIFVAKAERVDTAQLELEFAQKLAELDRIGGALPPEVAERADERAKPKAKPKGRRDLREAPIEERRIELFDELLEPLVARGEAVRIGFEESYRLGYQRGGYRKVIIARAKYQTVDVHGETMVEVTPMPPEAFTRSLAAPSLLAHVIVDKFCDGLPLNRIEDRAARDGVRLDRGTMSRWVEDAGATAGATVVKAMRGEALSTAFCIATDATGVKVQPERRADGQRQACRRGHYFVSIADRDHILFDYTAKEDSATVEELFAGFTGYLQADAKSVYDVLFREPEKPPDDDGEVDIRIEVGCWSHCRRRFWEATCAKSDVGREGLARIGRIFELDAAWRREPPAEVLRLRRQHLRPHLESFFAWAESEYEWVRQQRGLDRAALGYAVRQKAALLRVLDNGRLVLDNNRSERELRRIAVGRKGWLFVGSDAHGESAGHLFSLVASARLHGLDVEEYLRALFRVLPHWPRDRYLELAPKYWTATRARLDATQLASEYGPLTVPPASEQQPSPR